MRTLSNVMDEKRRAEKKEPPVGQKRRVILRSQLTIAVREAEEFLSDLAAYVKDRDAPLVPVENVRRTLQRGEYIVAGALRLLNEEEN